MTTSQPISNRSQSTISIIVPVIVVTITVVAIMIVACFGVYVMTTGATAVPAAAEPASATEDYLGKERLDRIHRMNEAVQYQLGIDTPEAREQLERRWRQLYKEKLAADRARRARAILKPVDRLP